MNRCRQTSRSTCVVFFALALLLGGTRFAQAAPITFGSVMQIIGDSDVSTTGTLVNAFNLEGVATTVNGVAFQPFAVPVFGSGFATVGNYTLSSGFFTGSQDTSNAAPPFASLSPAYRLLLGTAKSSIADMTLTISGLTLNQAYQFQVWVNDSSDDDVFGVTVSEPTHPANLVSLSEGNTTTLGEYVLATFTADAATQQITFAPEEVGLVNGFQLRALTAPAQVPEPSTLALLSTGVVGLVARRRAAAKKRSHGDSRRQPRCG